MKKVKIALLRSTRMVLMLMAFGLQSLLLIPLDGFAQNNSTVQGNITDSETNEPLAGVTVGVRGTNIGTTSDENGHYVISVPTTGSILVFSFVGYESREVSVNGKSVIDVQLNNVVTSIQEVVVIGYGQRDRRQLTEAVTSIQADQLNDLSKGGFDQMLQGKVPGIQVQQNSGAPGGSTNILVRGVHSITGSNQPLYVIDGFPVTTGGTVTEESFSNNLYSASSIKSAAGATFTNPLNLIDPSDIKSISILKDAQATAIYGSRGSNGVIIIETKRGSYGKAKITLNSSYGLQELSHKQELMNSQQYAAYVAEGRDNAWVAAGGKIDDPNSVRSVATRVRDDFRNPSSITVNTDWQDVIFRTAPITKTNLSVSGGTDKTNYYIAGGYFSQEGIIKRSGYERYNFRTNLNINVSNRLKIGTSTFFTFENNKTPNITGHYGKAGIISAVSAASPTIPVYDANGQPYFNQDDVTDGLGWLINPLVMIAENDIKSNTANFMSNNFVEYTIIDNLKFRSSFGLKYGVSNNSIWKSSKVPDNTGLVSPPTAANAKSISLNWINENILTYNKTWDAHRIDVLGGMTEQASNDDVLTASASNFVGDNIPYISGGIVSDGQQNINEWSLVSLLGRIDYAYKERFLFTASLRRDGSSRFGSKSRWGMFPSAAIGYILSEEEFLKNSNTISNLKITMNYGVTGNNNIGNYAQVGRISHSSKYVQNGGLVTGSYVSNLPNDKLQWEKTGEFNIGMDLGLFSNRISMTANVYKSQTDNLLLQVQIPAYSGFTSTTQNIGKVENKGLEIGINSLNIAHENFKWNTNASFSINKNKVKALDTETAQITNSSAQITRVGYPISSFYLLKQIGIFQDTDEISKSPLYHPKTQPGDPKFEDYDQNGTINQQDRYIVGDPWPDFTWGLNNSISYKNFGFDFSLVGSQGALLYDLSSQLTLAGVQNLYAELADRWSPTNPNGKYPRAIRNNQANNFATNSTMRLFDASYVRISNVGLRYKLSNGLISRLGLNNAELNFQISNLYTFTDYPGYDPEINTAGGNVTRTGIVYDGYPLSRSYILGISVSF